MSVRLISVTPDAEKTILYVARVSSDQTNENPGLLRYLIKQKHWSPFEMAHMTVEVITSRAIAQQIIRHWSLSIQEFSQRYSEVTNIIYYPARRQAEKNRQSSIDDLPIEDQEWWMATQKEIADLSLARYQEALDRGIAKECARFILPLATQTKLYLAGSLRSFIHFLELRTAEETQLEHREIALQIKDIFIEQFPTISDALDYS